jgi:aryl-alcohol dehydrogenase-like predicted oxidoreductase
MSTDHIDLLQFHGAPSPEVLEQQGAINTLRDLQSQGKVRFIGVSSVFPGLVRHIEMGVFDAFQIPYSALQREHEDVITRVSSSGLGTIIRGGAVRGAPDEDKGWEVRRLPEVSPERPRTFWESAKLDELLDGISRMEFTLRYTFSHPGLDTAIIGTANPEHLAENLESFKRGPLPDDVLEEANRRLNIAASRTA